jgi:hypothetical protein
MFFSKPKPKRKLRYTVKSKGLRNTNHYTLTAARSEKKKRRSAKIFKYGTRSVVK